MRKGEDTEEGGRERAREGRDGNTTYKVPRSMRQGGGEGGGGGGGVSAISITCVGRNDTSFCYYISHTRRQSVNPKCTRIFTITEYLLLCDLLQLYSDPLCDIYTFHNDRTRRL